VRRRVIVAAALAALLATACGGDEASTPGACLGGPAPYLDALRKAPDPVRLGGEVPISTCLVSDQEGGELARVGIAMLRAATELNSRARAAPRGPAAVQLGYLVGAVQKGAEETSGIHADLVRRLQAAAELSPGGRPLPKPLTASYASGIEAGQAGG
jgi:hypothetical protein